MTETGQCAAAAVPLVSAAITAAYDPDGWTVAYSRQKWLVPSKKRLNRAPQQGEGELRSLSTYSLSHEPKEKRESVAVSKPSTDPSNLPSEKSETLPGIPAETALDLSALDETHTHFLTLYLDTVFPLLFPWYQPSGLSGGRSWLLSMMRANKAVFHTAMSLSASYFTTVLAVHANHTLRTPCEQHVWDTLASHMDLSVRVMRQCMEDLGSSKQNSRDILRKTHVMHGIVHFLVFEVNMVNQSSWHIHLRAASTLFEEIFLEHGMKDGAYHLDTVLQAMESPSMFDGINLGFRVWNADQAAFQFSAALLLYADIISSVSLRKGPCLQHCHKHLIAQADEPHLQGGKAQGLIQLESYTGCRGWVLILIGEISALEEQKCSSQDGDLLVKQEIMQRAQRIQSALHDGMMRMSGHILSPFGRETTASVQHSHPQSATQHAFRLTLGTKIWIHAAVIYLETVVNGWYTTNPVILSSVRSVLELLPESSSEPWLRSLIWPLCVTGCVAVEGEEQSIRNIVSSLGPLKGFTSAKKAVQIMERVWQLRYQLDSNSWGLADCFNLDEYKYLLI